MSRKIIFGDGIFYIPNATHFAFVPAIVRLTNLPVVAKTCILTTYVDKKFYTEFREPYNSECIFDIQRYMQMAFSNLKFSTIDYKSAFISSPLKKTISCDIEWDNGALGSFDTDVIWGAISPRESSGGIMRRKWFVNYPFTLDVFARKGTSFDVRVDGGRSDLVFYNHNGDSDGATPYHRYLMNPGRLIDSNGINRSIHIAVPHSLVLKNDTETVGLIAYTLEIDRTRQGVYLRWIDRQGRYCYYLFRDLGSAAAISEASTWERNDMEIPTAYINGVNIATNVRQQITQKLTRSLGAHLVDAETYDFLLSLPRSVIVDVFDGYDENDTPLWHRVNIVPASYERTTKCLQDFIFSIEEPAQDAQMM